MELIRDHGARCAVRAIRSWVTEVPRPPKPPDRKQRRNKPKEVEPQLVAIQGELAEVPEPPSGLTPDLVNEWVELWTSPMATAFTPSVHLSGLRQLFKMRAMRDAFQAEGAADPVTIGSTGQERINPLLSQADKLQAQIVALEDRFGLNPKATMQLGVAIGQAQSSLEAMNERIRSKLMGGEVDNNDPRLAAIETTARQA